MRRKTLNRGSGGFIRDTENIRIGSENGASRHKRNQDSVDDGQDAIGKHNGQKKVHFWSFHRISHTDYT